MKINLRTITFLLLLVIACAPFQFTALLPGARTPTPTPTTTAASTGTPTLAPIAEFQMTNTAVFATLQVLPTSTPRPHVTSIIFEDRVPVVQRPHIQEMIDVARIELGDVGDVKVYAYYTVEKLPTGPDWSRYMAMADSVRREIYINSQSYERGLRDPWLYSTMPHEYYHLVQGNMAGRFGMLRTASWLKEGSAEYKSFHLLEKVGKYTYKQARDRKVPHALQAMANGTTLNLLELNPGARQPDSYELGFLAVEMLTSIAGEDSLDSYWKVIYTTTWEASFRQAFGLTVEEFYQLFTMWSTYSFQPQLKPK